MGPNANNTWDITAIDSGTLQSTGTGTVNFSAFEGLSGYQGSGGTGNNTFAFSSGAIVSSFIRGRTGTGTNTLNYTGYNANPVVTTVTVNLATTPATASGTNSGTPYVYDLYNINVVIYPNGNEVIYGSNTQFNTWIITGQNAGTLNGTSFQNAAYLVGGALGDLFEFAGGYLTGSITGGSGGSETVQSYNVSNTWTITGNNAGTLTEVLTGGSETDSFSNIPNLTAGSTSDTFIFDSGDGISGSIAPATGVSGAGTLDFLPYGTPLTVSLGTTSGTVAGSVTPTLTPIGGTFSGIATVEGTTSTGFADTLVGPPPPIPGTSTATMPES